MSALVGNTLQGEAAMLMATQPPKVRQGNYTPEQARKVAEEFEGVFLSQMLKPMFEGIETDGIFGGGEAEKMYRSLQIDEYGKSLARSGGIGIADEVMRQLLQVQEAN
jgi:Rod binding domain-containing protein